MANILDTVDFIPSQRKVIDIIPGDVVWIDNFIQWAKVTDVSWVNPAKTTQRLITVEGGHSVKAMPSVLVNYR